MNATSVLSARPSPRDVFHEPADLHVHRPDRRVVPVDLVADDRRRIDTGLRQLVDVRETLLPHVRVVDERLQLLDPTRVLDLRRRIGPERVVRRVRLERAVRVEDVEEDEERDVAMRIEPGQQPVDEDTRRLAPVTLRRL